METILVNSGIVGGLLLIYVSVVSIIALIKCDNSIMDIAYGSAFFTALIGTVIITDTSTELVAAIGLCIGLWSARLSTRIFKKNYGKPEDARYAAWREEWQKRGQWYFLLRSYGQIYLLQGSIIFLVSLPGIIALSSGDTYSLTWLTVGLIVFACGLTYETIADRQLDAFLARKRAGTESATLMTTGLFRYSRRPNYFGETLVWWGLAIMVLPLPFGYLALISPLVITYIVTQVTGPMLEKIFLEKYPAEYHAYMASTNYFIPGLPRT